MLAATLEYKAQRGELPNRGFDIVNAQGDMVQLHDFILPYSGVVIVYQSNLDGISAAQLEGFFVGWPNPPLPGTHLRILENSASIVLALEGDQVSGFVSAISDGVLSAYISLLEVLPSHQGRGVGRELMTRMKVLLEGLYMIDVLCDDNLLSFYEKLGFKAMSGAMIRQYQHQSGKSVR